MTLSTWVSEHWGKVTTFVVGATGGVFTVGKLYAAQRNQLKQHETRIGSLERTESDHEVMLHSHRESMIKIRGDVSHIRTKVDDLVDDKKAQARAEQAAQAQIRALKAAGFKLIGPPDASK